MVVTDDCTHHAWASVGIAAEGDSVVRIWLCEQCLAWTREPLDPAAEVPWSETHLAER